MLDNVCYFFLYAYGLNSTICYDWCRYILMAEPDHIFANPLPNLARGDHPAAFPFFYIKPAEHEEIIRKYYPEELGPVTNVDPIGNSPVIIKKVSSNMLNQTIFSYGWRRSFKILACWMELTIPYAMWWKCCPISLLCLVFWAGQFSGSCNVGFLIVAVHFGENCSYMDEYFVEDERWSRNWQGFWLGSGNVCDVYASHFSCCLLLILCLALKYTCDFYFLVSGMVMRWHLLYMVYGTFFERTSCYRSTRADLKYLFLHYVMLD